MLTDAKHEIVGPSPALPVKDVYEKGLPERPSPPDKPLPSLPIATVVTSPPVSHRSLIDASEKPLRTPISPSPGEKLEEEWPALFPSQPATSNTVKETVHDDSLDQTGSSACNRSTSNAKLIKGQHQHIEEAQNQPTITAPEHPEMEQGNQADAVTTQHPISTLHTQVVSGTTMERLKPGKEPSAYHAATKKTLATTVKKETISAAASTKSGLANNSAAGATPFTSNTKLLHPVVQRTATSRGSERARVSRLPRRLSVTGPLRSSSSSRGPANRCSSPYNSAQAHNLQSASVEHDHPSSNAKGPIDQIRPQPAGHTPNNAKVALQDTPSVIAVKQSSKTGHTGSIRSTIPRSRHQFRTRQDAESESESEIVVAKLSRKKMSSDRRDIDHNVDDGDLDTDEDHGNEDKELSQASETDRDKQRRGHVQQTERAKIDFGGEPALARPAQDVVSTKLVDSSDYKNPLTAALVNHQVDKSSATDLASAVEPYLDTSLQRPMIDKPLTRVKRLSATAPGHGPILRISDSADRIIMGYGSEGDLGQDGIIVRKRNSVPDLRRSVVVKELRKSTEGLLNGRLSLSRSTTTRSWSRYELKEELSERGNVGRHNNSSFRPQSDIVNAEASIPEDPFSICDCMTRANSDVVAGEAYSNSPLDWPLKSCPHALDEPQPVKEDSSGEGRSWISPSTDLRNPKVSEHSLSSPTNEESRCNKANSSLPASKNFQARNGHRSGREDVSPLVVANGSPLISNQVRSAVEKNAQFPPRTSSRANTPDVSAPSRLQISHTFTREIPNRFESARPRRLSEDFSLPKSISVNPEILRNSIYNLKDAERSKISTPATQEPSRAQLSSAKGMLSNFRGLFHKRSIDGPTSSTPKNKGSSLQRRHALVAAVNGSPHPNYHSRTLPATNGAQKRGRGGALVVPTPKDAFPRTTPSIETFSSGLDSDDYRQATDLAIRVLDAARTDHDSRKRARLLQVSLQPSFGSQVVDSDPRHSSDSSW